MPTTLLLVEDDSEVRAVLAELLALDQIRTLEAANGFDAWTLLDKDPRAAEIELVLSDIAMPKMNGFQLLEKMRTDPRYGSLPVVLTSGNADRTKTDFHASSPRFEPNAFFPKPFDFEKLIETIRGLLPAR